jgi:hypothetical protein
MVNSAQNWAFKIMALLASVAAMLGLTAATGHALPGVANVVICGYGDPNGNCADAMIAMGHIDPAEPIARPWYPADLNPFSYGMSGSTDAGLPNVLAAIDDFQRRGFFVRVHGYSEGSDLAIAAANLRQVGELDLYGSPFPAMGAFHGVWLNNPIVKPFLLAGKLTMDRPIPRNTTVHAYYNEGDLWANFVPNEYYPIQLINIANDTLAMQGHWIQPRWHEVCIFTDVYGVINHVNADNNPFTKNGCQMRG